MVDFQFRPLSLRSWSDLLSQTGIIGYALIFSAISGKFFDIRTSQEVISGSLSSAMVFRAVCLSGAIFILLFYMLRPIKLPTTKGNIVAFLYVANALLSTTWSVSPVATLGKSIELVVSYIVIIIASSQNNNETKLLGFFKIILYIIFIQLLISAIGFLVGIENFSEKSAGGLAELFPERITSPFISANSIGYSSALLLICIINSINYIKLHYKDVLYIVFISSLLLLSTSRTSVFIVIFAISLILFYKNKKLFYLAVIPISLLFILNANFLSHSMFALIQGDQQHNVAMTLSGRTVLWENAYQFGKESNPWLGVGFGVGSRAMFFLNSLQGYNSTISTAHNGLMEVFTGLGVVGVAIWIIAFYCYLKFSIANYQGPGKDESIYLGVWPVVLICTIMSVGIGGASNEIFIIFLIVLALENIKYDKLKKYRYVIKW